LFQKIWVRYSVGGHNNFLMFTDNTPMALLTCLVTNLNIFIVQNEQQISS